MLVFFSKYSYLLASFIVIYLFFLKKKHIAILLANLLIMFLSLNDVDNVTCLKLSALVNIFALKRHHKHLSQQTTMYLLTISIGLFFLSVIELKHQQILDFIINNNHIFFGVQPILIVEFLTLIAVLLMIGFVPFASTNMSLLLMSSPFLLISSLIFPMYISINVFKDISSSFNKQVFELFGLIICIFTVLPMLLAKQTKIITLNAIIYFYGIQIIFLPQNNSTTQLLLIWLFFSSLLLAITNAYTTRTKDCSLQNLFEKYTKKQNLFIIIPSIIAIIVILTNTAFVLSKSILIYMLIPMIYFSLKYLILFFKYIRNHDTCQLQNDTIVPIQTSLFIFFLSIISILQLKHLCINAYLKVSFIQIIYFIIAILALLFLFKMVDRFFSFNNNKKRNTRIVSNIFIKLASSLKTSVLIINAVCEDFVTASYKKITYFSPTSLMEKISNVLYGNHTYFYIFFLLQLIIILTIECVIL